MENIKGTISTPDKYANAISLYLESREPAFYVNCMINKHTGQTSQPTLTQHDEYVDNYFVDDELEKLVTDTIGPEMDSTMCNQNKNQQ